MLSKELKALLLAAGCALAAQGVKAEMTFNDVLILPALSVVVSLHTEFTLGGL